MRMIHLYRSIFFFIDLCSLIFSVRDQNDPAWGFYYPLTNTALLAMRPRSDVTAYWREEIQKYDYKKVAEFGPGGADRRFQHANIVIDHFAEEFQAIPGVAAFHIDVDIDQVPVGDEAFDFVYSRHLLEDINNPVGAFREMTRLSRRGYIETPSPLIESLQLGSRYHGFNDNQVGFPHHRFLFWTDISTNTLYGIPKYPLIDRIFRPDDQLQIWVDALESQPHLFNNYYQWDVDNNLPPKLVMLKQGLDFDLTKPGSYRQIIEDGAQLSVDHTIAFFMQYIVPFLEVEDAFELPLK